MASLDLEKDLGPWTTADNACETFQNDDCWWQIYRMDNFVQYQRGYNDYNAVLDVVDITMNFDPEANTHIEASDADEPVPIDWFYLCEATDNKDPEYPQPEPDAPPKPPSGQWDKCEEVELCNTSTMDLMLQPAGWTSTDMNYNRVPCFYQATVGGFVGIRQSEFEKVPRFNTNSAIWIVGADSPRDFKSDTIADQCEINQEEGCWRAIGKGERLFKVMRGMSYTTTKLDTTVLNVDGRADRMIICDADQHSFDVDEPDPEAAFAQPDMKNKYCRSGIMWHNSEGEPAQRWTLSEEKFTDLPRTIDADKIYTDGNGRYMYWEWIGFQGRWYISA